MGSYMKVGYCTFLPLVAGILAPALFSRLQSCSYPVCKNKIYHSKKWLVKTTQNVVNAVSVSPCCMFHYMLYVGIKVQ